MPPDDTRPAVRFSSSALESIIREIELVDANMRPAA